MTLRLQVQGKHIAVDGKTSRRSFDKGNERPATHTVSAWMSEAGLVLGQRKTETKSNEITAIPELLRVLDLRGATITIHWVLDMAFREDEARHRVRNISQNFTTLRHFALNIIKQDSQRKVGIALSRKCAGWDRSYLIALMTGTTGS